MDWTATRKRFAFLSEAYAGSGGFCPNVQWRPRYVTNDSGDVVGQITEPLLIGSTRLVQHPRESSAKFAGRNALATYENHLRTACKRFVSFLCRRRPKREGADAPLVQLLLQDADLRGTALNNFLVPAAAMLKALGSVLVVLDEPQGDPAVSLQDQIARRRVPYVRLADPSSVISYRLDPDSGQFVSVTLESVEWWDDEETLVERDYTTTGWRVRKSGTDKVLAEGAHSYGVCQVLYATESGAEFPVIGEYAQIADMSLRLFNARSERDDILRGQTFSILTMQVPPEHTHTFDASKVSATIGTHSMLVHTGDAPAFIAPDSGPAEVYAQTIAELEQSIRRVSMDDSTEQSAQPESGIARRMRFEQLNADVSSLAQQLLLLEMRIWALFHRATGSGGDVTVAWPDDFNLADVQAELDILTTMQLSGFPPAVLDAKRRAIVAIEFDSEDEAAKAELIQSVDEFEQEAAIATGIDGTQDPGSEDQSGATGQPAAQAAQVTPTVDVAAIAQAVTTAIAELQIPAPIVNIAAPLPTPPAPQTITVESPQITVNVPEHQPANVTVEAPQVNVAPPAVTVNMPEQPAAQVNVAAPSVTVAPPNVSVTVEKGGKLKFIEDANGTLTGAELE